MLIRHRWFLATALASLVFATAYASAASLAVGGGSLAAGVASVEACDPDGVTTAFTAPAFQGSAYIVDQVTVRGIAHACVGRDFVVMLADGSGIQLAEEHLSGVTGEAFGGSADALTLGFDFSAQRVPIDHAQTVFVSIFR